MNILYQIFYSAKRVIVDIKPLLIRMISFIVIILILGSAFSNAFEVTSLDIIKVVYYSEDAGKNGEAFMDTLIEVDSIKEMVEFKEASSFKDGEDLVNSGKAGAFIYIPKDYTEQLASKEDSGTIEVYCKKYSGVNATVIESVLDSFINGMNTAWVVYDMTGTIENLDFSTTDSLKTEPVSDSNSTTAMGYYAVSMLLMLILYGSEYGCYGISEDYIGVLGDRIKLSPIKPYQQYIGKIIGFSLATFLQASFLILFTKFVYGVSWGNNYILLLLVVLTYSFLANTLGAMFIAITRDLKKAGSLVSISVIGFTFLAGGFVIGNFGTLEKFSPSYYAKTAIFNIVYNGYNNITLKYVGIMWGIILAITIVSVMAARRKRA